MVSFDLEDLIDDCLQLFGATAAKRHIDLMGGVHPHVPCSVIGDATRLRQIVINLLSNAFKFTNEGFVALEVTLDASSTPEGPVLHFSVQDSGIGLAKIGRASCRERVKSSEGEGAVYTKRQRYRERQ